MLKKSAQATLNIAKETYEAIKKKDYNELSNLILKDKIVDRYTAFGSRIINKNFELDYPITGPLYLILDETEIAADIFKIISKTFIEKKQNISKNLLLFFNEIINLMDLQFSILFNFNMEKVKKLGKLETKIRLKIDKLCNTEKNNIKILAYLINLFETVFEIKSAILTVHMAKLGNEIQNESLSKSS